MKRYNLKTRDYESLLAAIEQLGACDSYESLKQATMEVTLDLLGCDLISYNELDLLNNRIESGVVPDSPNLQEDLPKFESLMSEHPVIKYMTRTGDGTAWKITDFVTQEAFLKSDLYTQFYKYYEVEYQMAISFRPSSRHMIGLACARNERSGDFGEKDRRLLNEIRPHLLNLWRSIMRLEQNGNQAVETLESGLEKSLLSKREIQVLSWISEGRTNVEIARLMGVSALTIKTHVQKILRKLSAKNRAHAVSRARELDLLTG